ncbi:uncharacterized protein LOC120112582 [Phoenix dactylifera]|uniref:Uncharacterized protein LOC120112582 n=1 Tax=Phoenix dactylifera TaxID=42345 RepID=A0A8B9AXG2_PHODC|nr:uncharacterized protein LOC120112582 [Phoenix dactylifera]
MKERRRSLLGTTAAVLVLVLVLMICVSSSSQYSVCHGNKRSGSGRGRTARKLVSGAILAQQQQQDMRFDGTMKPLNQAGVSFRKIPPSSSNPTQNKSRPRVDGPGNP